MGRHSRQGGPQGPAADTTQTTGTSPYAAGTGRRRRTAPADAPRVPRPRAAESGGPVSGSVPGTPAFGTPVVPPQGGPGPWQERLPHQERPPRQEHPPHQEYLPRQEYLEAFDGPGRPGGRGAEPVGLPPVGTPPAGSPMGFPQDFPHGGADFGTSTDTDFGPDAGNDTDTGSGAATGYDADTGNDSGRDADAGNAPSTDGGARTPRKGTKARTLTGAAAAAVTTALAVVIAGQVTDQHRNGGVPQARSGDDRADGVPDTASRSARTGRDAKPADFATQMAQVFPLDPQLTASGRFQAVGGAAEAPGHGTVRRYRVDVEEGLPLDGKLFADAVHRTLNDERSWAHGGRWAFQRVASGDADFVISLASPGTTAKWCAKSGLDTTEDNVSCDSALTKRVMINAYRWAQGATTYGPDKMLAYRQMLINHEVGHRLGHNHEVCSRQGAPAPVMMQQTKFLTTDGATCRPNSWPYPTGR